MSKIICDVCGTRYPETTEQCPICGRIVGGGGSTIADDILMDQTQSASGGNHVKGGRFSKSNVRKRNEQVDSYDMPEQQHHKQPKAKFAAVDTYGASPTEQEQRPTTGLNIALAVVIISLICVTIYIFVNYFMPSVLDRQDPAALTTKPSQIITEAPTEAPTEEPTVPCTGLELIDGDSMTILEQKGQNWLLNIVVSPEDTTDQVYYTSTDEAVVTVDTNGCLTAVGEGQASILVTCGDVQISYDVVCVFQDAGDGDKSDGADGDDNDNSDNAEDATEPDAATGPLKNVTLTVDLTDITFNAKDQGYTFKCGELSREEVTWVSENEGVVTVEDGKALSVGKGTTNIIAKYGDQEVTIVVRCDF